MHRPSRRLLRRRSLLHGLLLLPVWASGLVPARARAQAQTQTQQAELQTLALQRDEGQLTLEFAVRLNLSRSVEDALQRGIPVYFVAEAALYKRRWYWRNERLARVRRVWRLAFQPLTSTWRVGLGALNQSFPTLPEALAALSTSGHWKIIDLAELDPESRHYVDFSYRLDATQLPSPMQIGIGGQTDWVLRIDRELTVD